MPEPEANIEFKLAAAGVTSVRRIDEVSSHKREEFWRLRDQILEEYKRLSSEQQYQAYFPSAGTLIALTGQIANAALKSYAKIAPWFEIGSKLGSEVIGQSASKYLDGRISLISGELRSEENLRDKTQSDESLSQQRMNSIMQAILEALRSLR